MVYFDSQQLLNASGRADLKSIRVQMMMCITEHAERFAAPLDLDPSMVAERVDNRFELAVVDGVPTIGLRARRRRNGREEIVMRNFLDEILHERLEWPEQVCAAEPVKKKTRRARVRGGKKKQKAASPAAEQAEREARCSTPGVTLRIPARNAGARMYTYLRVMTEMAALDASRKRRREDENEPWRLSGRSPAGGPGDRGGGQVWKAMAALSPLERRVFEDRILCGMSMEEVADCNAKSLAVVRKAFTRAKKKLRVRLEKDL